jgi:hypothetical protein
LGIKSGDAENDLRLSLTSRLGNALALSLQSKGLKTKNLLKQAWQIFLCSSLVAPGRFIVEDKGVKSNYFVCDLKLCNH